MRQFGVGRGGLIAHFIAAKSPPEPQSCLLHGQRVTSWLSRHRASPEHGDTQINATPVPRWQIYQAVCIPGVNPGT